MRLECLVLSLSLTLLTPASISACTCNVPPPACFEYWRSEAVFTGTVKKVNPVAEALKYPPTDTVEVSVDEAFRGVSAPLLSTFNYAHSCAHTFKEGDSFLFYGGLDKKEPTEFGTSLCTRTSRLTNDLVDLEFLRAVKENREVYWAWGTVTEWATFDRPLKGIRAEVLGKGIKIEGVSNDAGDIKLEVPKPGTYRIRIHLPKGRTDNGGFIRNELELWQMQRKQIVGGRFKGSHPYVDYQVQVEPNRCGWFDVSIPRNDY